MRSEARRAARDVVDRLAPLAVRTDQGATDDEQVLSASVLLRAADETRFREAVAARARDCGGRLALSVTGPLPCYSFVDPRHRPRPAGDRVGIVSGLLLLPLAPVRGTAWIADHLLHEARRQAHDPRAVQARLAALNHPSGSRTIWPPRSPPWWSRRAGSWSARPCAASTRAR
ncbi:GvpL/GvpF family gas vesicle protein [Streptomyces sp. NPDC048392]|uniref:GvpL/GvpF family gas vesicle protein n=1 Tax=Streptomyces sp. NPDC048392 TaxID=3365543 RepID=UPI003712F04E